ncbi:HEAT repeat domain-containing protein [Pyxidicoccus parkwayensis]|uniref:HEAT repeat domain-containing protein n=1 Tax=Pyxidicoccus parkwayensis TaxID=2813578 RepID=A0ABX7P1D9_9BACT|nr:HEAT repeat domain-containing protein [Pyxidicoccus parkwaysis]QSQ22268.1 HEAT repeat domain-containing protein [Pyxidicoccus parkwaysis]
MPAPSSQSRVVAPAPGAPPPLSPEDAATEVGHALSKVLNAYRFYAEGHASLVDFQQKFFESVTRYHGATGQPAVLHVRSSAVVLGEAVLLEATSAKDSVTRPLFLEGVQEVLLQPGVTLDELRDFLGMWHRALQRTLPPEHDFYTLFWERGFEDIELVVAEVPSTQEGGPDSARDEALLAEREEQLFSELTRRQAGGGGRRRPVGHDEWLARLEAEVLAPVSAQDLVRTGAPAFAGTTEAEVAELRAALERERGGDGVLERSLRMVWELLAVCREEERPELLGWAEELLTGLAAQGRWAELLQAVREMTRDARASGTRAPDLYALTRLFLQREGLRLTLASAAERSGELSRVMELLNALPRDALLAGPELLFALEVPAARAALVKLLVSRGVALGALVSRAASLREVDLEWVQPLRESGPEAQPLTAALLAHPTPGVRAAVMSRLGLREVEAHKSVLLKALSDAVPSVRGAALALVVRHGVEAAVGTLVSRLDTALDAKERMAVLRALADLGGPAAAAALRASFEREQDTELKAHCARCIGVLGDPRARPLLEAVAQKLFAPRALRQACREALAQLAPVG